MIISNIGNCFLLRILLKERLEVVLCLAEARSIPGISVVGRLPNIPDDYWVLYGE
jgi:hypothetical protein